VPLERVSQSFKDVSMSFKVNPLNNDLVALKNTNAIARSVRNIILTSPGEKFFNPDFGSNVSKLLFENLDEVTALAIRDEIETAINNYEPRVSLIDVEVTPDFDNNSLDAKIKYRIVGADIPPQQLEFVLLPTR
jgi:phage baseplate assembly protein W|tara:strand:+ start:1386 stop:1787 length:402 start_codon:yes stop_codon:yes gene_type:complete